ncbi:MAG: class II aldolase/adducin family protein [Desulfobacterales bacterium]|nr:class II aldolase/adducin family protein [Desulfobacterales bacterium]
MDIEQCNRHALAIAAGNAFRRHLTCAGLGAISVRLPLDGLFLITPFGVGLGDVRPEEICLFDARGKGVEASTGLAAPPETPLYLNAYRERPYVNAIAHLHPPYATAYAVRGRLFPLLTGTGRRVLKEVLKVDCRECPSRLSGLCICNTDVRLGHAGVGALLIKEDGILTLGADLAAVLHLADLVENTAKAAYLAATQRRD